MVEDRIVNEIKEGILNFDYYEPTRITTSLKYYTEKFYNNISNNDKRLHRYITEVVELQGRYIVDKIKNKKPIVIPNLGTFTIKYAKEYKANLLESLPTNMDDEEKSKILIDRLRKLKISSDKKKIYKNMLKCISNSISNRNI